MSNWVKKPLSELVWNGSIELGRGRVISKLDIQNNPGPYPIYSSSAKGDGRLGTYGKYMFDEELITWSVDGGGNLFYRPKHQFSVTNVSGFIRVHSRSIDYRFLHYLLSYQHSFITFDYQTKAHPSVIKNLYYFVPLSISEQRTIADILSTVDDAIEQTEALIRKYQRIKQGLMQDLLDNPSWPTHKLGDPELFSLYTGGTPSTEISEYWGGSIPWLSSGEVHKKRIWDTEKKITELGYKKSNARYIPVHSTLIALAGQGKTRGTAAITEIEITTNQSIAAIMPNEAKIDPYFLFHSLDYQYLRLRAASAGAGRAGLNLQLLAQFEIKVPNLISEQRSIAEYFETLDNTMHENLILKGKLVQLKQGLMQDLLTGKVRVNALLEQ